jgi:hypothetical protein
LPRNQRQTDAEILLVTEQPIRVVHAEGDANQRSDRGKRDVALVEIEPDSENLLAFVLTLADDAMIRNRRCIGSCRRPGQAEAGDVLAAGQPRQVVVLLLFGAVMQQEFAGSERVRHRHRRTGDRTHGRNLLQYGAVRHRGETEAAIFLGNDHAEETVFLEKRPGFRVEVGVAVVDLPVIQHVAQLLDRAIDEGLLLDAELEVRLLFQKIPVWTAGKKFALPADCPGVQSDLLGFRDLRQHPPEFLQKRTADELLAPGFDVEYCRDCGEHDGYRHQAQHGYRPGRRQQHDAGRHGDSPGQKGGAVKGTSQRNGQHGQ